MEVCVNEGMSGLDRCFTAELMAFGMNHLPTIIFCIGYMILIGNLLLSYGAKKAPFLKVIVFLMLASQAYDFWRYLEYFIQKILDYCYNTESRNVTQFLVLTCLASVPLMTSLLKNRRRREFLISWRNRGPRTELGPMSYYLLRPFRDLRPLAKGLRKIRSQSQLRPKESTDQRPPKSA